MQDSVEPLIIVVGHAALDSIYRIGAFPTEPTKVRALEHLEAGGGSGANAATAIARLAGKVEFWCRLGADDAGRRICEGLAADHIDTRYVMLFDGARSSQSAVIVDAHGERLIISDPDHGVPAETDWLPLDHILGAGAVLSDMRWIEGTEAAFGMAKQHGVPTIADIDVTAGAHARRFLPQIEYAIFSEPGLGRFAPQTAIEDGLAQAIAFGARHAGVTRGGDGYVWLTREFGMRHQPAFAIEPVDTTGAGDAFHGAFAWALAQGHDDAACARVASAVAALKCRRLSARAGLPSRRELQDFLESSSRL